MTTKLKTKTTRKTKAATSTPQKGAAQILDFISSGSVPDFLSTIVQIAVDHACDHVGYMRPLYTEDDAFTKGDNTRLIANLCRKTEMLSLSDFEGSEASLARHIVAIIEHPQVPTDLYNVLTDRVTNYVNIQNSQGDSLLNNWQFHPDTVTACIKWANELEAKKEAAEELEMRTVPRGRPGDYGRRD